MATTFSDAAEAAQLAEPDDRSEYLAQPMSESDWTGEDETPPAEDAAP